MTEPFESRLERFKSAERPEAVLLVEGRPELIRVVLAWPITRVAWKSYAIGPRDDSEASSWQWLWESAEFLKDELARKTGLNRTDLESALDVLIGNRILYPDGTVHSQVEQFLRRTAIERLSEATFAGFEEAMSAGHEALRGHRFADAERAFACAVPLASRDEEKADALHFTAWSVMNQKRYEEARKYLARIGELGSARPDQRGSAMHLTAHSFINEGRGHLADEWFDRIVALEGAGSVTLCEARVARGYSLRAKRKYREALDEFARCMAVEGGLSVHRGSALFHSALTHLDLDDREQALQGIKQFLEMAEVYPEERKRAEELLTKLI